MMPTHVHAAADMRVYASISYAVVLVACVGVRSYRLALFFGVLIELCPAALLGRARGAAV